MIEVQFSGLGSFVLVGTKTPHASVHLVLDGALETETMDSLVVEEDSSNGQDSSQQSSTQRTSFCKQYFL